MKPLGTLVRNLTVIGAIGAVLGLAGAAYASPPWTVAAGNSSSGTVSYTAATAGGSPQIHINAPAYGFTCTDGTATGNITLGSTSGQIGSITSTTFNGCVGLLSLPLTITQNGIWNSTAIGPTVNGVTPARVTNVSAHVANPGGLCSFDVTGTVDGNFNNNNQQLAITGPSTLRVSNVSGCFGLFANGSPLTFTGSYAVSNAVGPITIS